MSGPTVQEYLALGGLADGSPTVKALRSRLQSEFRVLGQFQAFAAEAALGTTPEHRALLQDGVNALGRFLGFKVEFGSYGVNVRRPIQFDGFWQCKSGNAFLMFLKTHQPTRLAVTEILQTLKKLNTPRQAAAGVRIFALMVVTGGDFEGYLQHLPRRDLIGRATVVSLPTLFALADRTLNAGRSYKMMERLMLPLDPVVLDRRLELVDLLLEAGLAGSTLPGMATSTAGPPGTLVGTNPDPLDETFPNVGAGPGPMTSLGLKAAPPQPSQPAPAAAWAAQVQQLRQQAELAEAEGRASEALQCWEAILSVAPQDPVALEGADRARMVTGGGLPPLREGSASGILAPGMAVSLPSGPGPAPPAGLESHAPGPGPSAGPAPEAMPAPPPPPAMPSADAMQQVQEGRRALTESRVAEAVPLLEAAAEGLGNDPTLFRDLGLAKGMAGDREGSQVAFSRCLQMVGNYLPGYREVALAALRAGQPETAEDTVISFLTSNPDDPKAYVLLGEVYCQLGREKDGAEAFENALNLAPGSAETLCDLARASCERGDLARAEQAVDAALQIDPAMAQAHAYRADVRRLRGDLLGARAGYDKARTLDPTSIPARLGQALLMEEAGQQHEAAQVLEQLLQEDPGNTRVQTAVLRAQARSGQAQRTLQLADYILANDPRNLSARTFRGISLYNLGEVENATRALEQVLQDAVHDPQVLLYLGLCYFSLQRWEESIEALEESTRHDPALVDAYLYLGFGYRNLGNGMDAALNFTKVLNLEPENEAARQGMMSLG